MKRMTTNLSLMLRPSTVYSKHGIYAGIIRPKNLIIARGLEIENETNT